MIEQRDGQPDIEVVGAHMSLSAFGVWADLVIDDEAWYESADDAKVLHQRAQGYRDGEARGLDLFGLLASVAAAVTGLIGCRHGVADDEHGVDWLPPPHVRGDVGDRDRPARTLRN